MLTGLPVAERRPAVAGSKTSILEGGDGPPLVLLHGGIECGGAYWAPVIPALADRHRLIVPDVPGLGESEPVARLDSQAFGRWFEALLELTCEEPPVLVAHSLLGGLAARFAALRPGRLNGVCLYAAPAVGPYRMPFRLRAVAIRFALRTTERNNERFERFALLDRERTRVEDPAWFDSFSAYTLTQARIPHVQRTMNQLVRAGASQVMESELRRITAPVSLVFGRRRPGGSDRGRQLGPIAFRLAPVRLDDAGHAPHIEQPRAFLRCLEPVLGSVAVS